MESPSFAPLNVAFRSRYAVNRELPRKALQSTLGVSVETCPVISQDRPFRSEDILPSATERPPVIGCRRGLVVVVVVLLASPGLAAAVGGAQTTDAHFGDRAASTGGGSVASFAQENNSTRHEHPDEVNERGDLADVERWLAGRMVEQLARSSVELSEGEYELAREYVGEEYRDRYGQYVEVAGETSTDRDDESADAFEAAREDQDELVLQVRTFRETREEYRAAKEADDEERARRLARELQRQADAINGTAADLKGHYGRISNTTSANMSEGSTAVREVRRNVSEDVDAVRREEFVATDLSLSVASTEISFVEPLEATGRLVTANGTPVADRRVRFHVGARQVTTRTDDEGRFSLTYRPTTIPVGEQTVAVRYVPENASVYLGSSEQVSVTVEQVQPGVDLASEFDDLAFGDRLVVDGSIAADGVGASGVPVAVFLGDERLGTVTTTDDGSFTFEGRVPATVADGERTLSVRVSLEDRALARAEASTDVQIRSTETLLTLEERTVTSEGVRVSGTLVTAAGLVVPDQRVAVTLDGTRIGTIRTTDDGSFTSILDVPGQLRPESGSVSLELVASFDGEGTNLEGSQDSATVEVPAIDAAEPNGPDGSSEAFQFPLSLPALLGGVAVLAIAGGAIVLRRRDRGGGDEPGSLPADAAPDGARDPPTAQAPPEPTPLDTAAQRLDEGLTDAAVEIAYEAVRSEIGATLDVGDARTHWEFLRASQAAGLNGDGYAALEALTEGYERAAFAPRPVPVDEAEQAVESARSLDRFV
jgi:hypothetical protein